VAEEWALRMPDGAAVGAPAAAAALAPAAGVAGSAPVVAATLAAAAHQETGKRQQHIMWQRIKRTFKHRWLDESDSHKAVPADLAERLRRRVAASEQRHTGEVRICVEAGLPMSYLKRNASARQRAVAMFGKLRVWDTQNNNGVLIYLLLADHAIEIVADRGLNAVVTPSQWQGMIANLSQALRENRYEDGLTQALEEVSALLVQHFPMSADATNPDELSDVVVLM
jgi:TPM domain